MAFGSWVVSAVVRFSTNGVTTMTRLASATNSANTAFLRQQGLISKSEAALRRYETRIAAVAAAQNRFVTGLSLGGAAVGALAIGTAIHDASKLQTILTTIRNITDASPMQMEKIYRDAFTIGNRSGQTPEEIADTFREIARQTQGAMSLNDMRTMLPYASQMQMVMGAARGMGPKETVDSTLALTHLFRQYDAKGMPKMMDTVLRMGELMPDNLSRAVTQMGYFAPTLKSMHVSNEDAAALMVAISRFGLGRGKGGTSIANLFSGALGPLQMTAHQQAGKAGLLGPHGLNVLDEKGKSRYFDDKHGDAMGYLLSLSHYAQVHGETEAGKVFTSVFGKPGGKLAMMLSDPIIINQLKLIHKAVVEQSSLGLKRQSDSIYGTAGFQMKRAGANFGALFTELGYTWLPEVTKFFGGLADALHGFQAFLHANRGIEKGIGAAVGVFTALFAIRFSMGTVSMLKKGAEALGMFGGGRAAAGASLLMRMFRLLDVIFLAGFGKTLITWGLKLAPIVVGLAATLGLPVWGTLFLIGAGLAAIALVLTQWKPILEWMVKAKGLVDGAGKNLGTWAQKVLPHTVTSGQFTAPGTGDTTGIDRALTTHPRRQRTRSVGAGVHIENVAIHINGAQDPKAVGAAVHDALENPLSTMRSAAPQGQTHARVPRPLSVLGGR